MRRLLADIGLEPERVRMVNLSAAMGGQFAAVAEELTAAVKTIGPNPLRAAPQAEEMFDNRQKANHE